MMTKMVKKDLKQKVTAKIEKARNIFKKPYSIELQHKKTATKKAEAEKQPDSKPLQTT